MNYYKHHIGDFNNATRHLTRIERSIYRDLLDLYFDKESPIKNDLEFVYKRTLAHSDVEKEAVKTILLEFFFLDENSAWCNERCDADVVEYQKGQTQAAKNKDAVNIRKERSRAKRKALFAELAELGGSIKWNSNIGQVQAELSRIRSQGGHAIVTAKPEPEPKPEPEKNSAKNSHIDTLEEIQKREFKEMENGIIDQCFEIFWLSGIRKDNKLKTEPLFKKILRKKFDFKTNNTAYMEFTKKLVLDIKKRIEVEQLGFDKMLPTTYLNNERWNDSIVEKTVEEKLLKLPADNEMLWQTAIDNKLPNPASGEDFFTYRARLNTHIQENQIFRKGE